MNWIAKCYYFFTRVTDSREARVARFFRSYSTHSRPEKIQAQTRALMSDHLVPLTLYSEWKFKGYRALTKSHRRRYYRQWEDLCRAFDRFCEERPAKISAKIPTTFPDEKRQLVANLLGFLRPGRVFEYQESRAFFQLLQDPDHGPLIGDCNQICTLYLALYARQFPVTDWQVHLVPGHVCLHWGGVDVECTSATLTQYKHGKIVGVEEMVSTNILDIPEPDQDRFTVVPKVFAQAAILVRALSTEYDIAAHNLEVALTRLAQQALSQHKYEEAVAYFLQAEKPNEAQKVYQIAVQQALKDRNFSQAKTWAQRSKNKDLIQRVAQHKGHDLLQQKKYEAAAKVFRRLGDSKREKICWNNALVEVNNQLKSCQTLEHYRQKRSTIKRLLTLAKKAHNESVITFCREILRKI